MPLAPPVDPGFWTKTSLLQLGYGVWINLTMVVIGLSFGFTAVALPQLSKPSSDLHITIADRSWITSVITILSPFGCIITGYLLDKLGRRWLLVMCHVPVIIGWLCTALATSAMGLIIGRTITGFGIGMIVVAPRPYLSEISLPNMRGVIGTFQNLALSVGIVIQAGLGSLFKWRMLCYISMGYSIVLMLSNCFLPETPHYLLMTSTMEHAEASLRKFRAKDYPVHEEIEELRNFKANNNIRSLTWREKVIAFRKPSTYKPFLIIVFYFFFTQFAGISVMTMWTVEIIQHSKCSLDANAGNFIVGNARFLSGIFTSAIIFKVGRRPLALTSSLGVGAFCIGAGLYVIYTTQLTIFPIICYTITTFSSSLGYYTLPQLIVSEIYPLQVRGIMGGISSSINYFLIFVVNKIYPYLTGLMGFAETIIMFGVFSFGCLFFLYFFLPETKGLTLQDIEEYFNNRRHTLERAPSRLIQTLDADKNKGEKKQDERNTDQRDKGSTSNNPK